MHTLFHRLVPFIPCVACIPTRARVRAAAGAPPAACQTHLPHASSCAVLHESICAQMLALLQVYLQYVGDAAIQAAACPTVHSASLATTLTLVVLAGGCLGWLAAAAARAPHGSSGVTAAWVGGVGAGLPGAQLLRAAWSAASAGIIASHVLVASAVLVSAHVALMYAASNAR
eukprot:365039-Chlamydomonas_euryale.AAC.1